MNVRDYSARGEIRAPLRIPEGRQALRGRTWAQCWEPRAIEHHRAPRSSLLDWAFAVALGLAGALTLVWALTR